MVSNQECFVFTIKLVAVWKHIFQTPALSIWSRRNSDEKSLLLVNQVLRNRKHSTKTWGKSFFAWTFHKDKRNQTTNRVKDHQLNTLISSQTGSIDLPLVHMLLPAGPHVLCFLWHPALPKHVACSPSPWDASLPQAGLAPWYCQLSIGGISAFFLSQLSSKTK